MAQIDGGALFDRGGQGQRDWAAAAPGFAQANQQRGPVADFLDDFDPHVRGTTVQQFGPGRQGAGVGGFPMGMQRMAEPLGLLQYAGVAEITGVRVKTVGAGAVGRRKGPRARTTPVALRRRYTGTVAPQRQDVALNLHAAATVVQQGYAVAGFG